MQYDTYRFGLKGRVVLLLIWAIVSALVSYFFYRSIWAGFLFFLLFPVFFKIIKKECIRKRKWRLKSQFADALLGVSTALQSGNSMENAFRKAYGEISRIYGENAEVVKELYIIVKGIENNMTIESLISDFARRSAVEEIEEFADIFAVGKRSGGNIREIMAVCCKSVSEQIEMQREFRVLTASNRFELHIMSLMPFGILIYIGWMSKGFFDGLYHNFRGVMLMTACLITYLTAYLWGRSVIEKTTNW